MKEIPISKVDEALSALADSRISQVDESTWKVVSSDHSKAYTVIQEQDTYSSNDNATVWQHYAGYPIIAVLFYEKRIPFDPSLLGYFKAIPWKVLNTKYKNNYDLSIQEAFQSLDEPTRQAIQAETERLKKAVESLPLTIKGNRKPLVALS
jgi:hypothetical protein